MYSYFHLEHTRPTDTITKLRKDIFINFKRQLTVMLSVNTYTPGGLHFLQLHYNTNVYVFIP